MEENKINESVSTPASAPVAETVMPTPGIPSIPTGVVYAGFWRRVLAWIIDGIPLAIVYNIIQRIMGVDSNEPAFFTLTNSQASSKFYLAALLGVVVSWLYYSLMESSIKQATLGKMAIRVKVTDMNGQKISFGRATGRFFAKIISTLILWIGYIMVAFTSRKQGLHDIIAGTLVVKK